MVKSTKTYKSGNLSQHVKSTNQIIDSIEINNLFFLNYYVF